MDVTLELSELRRTCKAMASYSEDASFKDITDYRMYLIVKQCCDHFGESYSSIMEKSRKREKVVVRQVSMYLIKKIFKEEISLKRIGLFFVGLDHSTVIHGIQSTQDGMDTNKRFKEQVDYLESILV